MNISAESVDTDQLMPAVHDEVVEADHLPWLKACDGFRVCHLRLFTFCWLVFQAETYSLSLQVSFNTVLTAGSELQTGAGEFLAVGRFSFVGYNSVYSAGLH